eukprot:394278-Alexandrium_andersonii.AAC.1
MDNESPIVAIVNDDPLRQTKGTDGSAYRRAGVCWRRAAALLGLLAMGIASLAMTPLDGAVEVKVMDPDAVGFGDSFY